MHLPIVTAVLGLSSSVIAHGVITKPVPRVANAAGTAACGTAVAKKWTADVTDHVEGLPEVAAADTGYNAAACNLCTEHSRIGFSFDRLKVFICTRVS